MNAATSTIERTMRPASLRRYAIDALRAGIPIRVTMRPAQGRNFCRHLISLGEEPRMSFDSDGRAVVSAQPQLLC